MDKLNEIEMSISESRIIIPFSFQMIDFRITILDSLTVKVNITTYW